MKEYPTNFTLYFKFLKMIGKESSRDIQHLGNGRYKLTYENGFYCTYNKYGMCDGVKSKTHESKIYRYDGGRGPKKLVYYSNGTVLEYFRSGQLREISNREDKDFI